MAVVRAAVTAVGLVWLAATGSADVRADLEVIKLFSKTGEGSLTLMYSDFSANIMANGGHNKSAGNLNPFACLGPTITPCLNTALHPCT